MLSNVMPANIRKLGLVNNAFFWQHHDNHHVLIHHPDCSLRSVNIICHHPVRSPQYSKVDSDAANDFMTRGGGDDMESSESQHRAQQAGRSSGMQGDCSEDELAGNADWPSSHSSRRFAGGQDRGPGNLDGHAEPARTVPEVLWPVRHDFRHEYDQREDDDSDQADDANRDKVDSDEMDLDSHSKVAALRQEVDTLRERVIVHEHTVKGMSMMSMELSAALGELSASSRECSAILERFSSSAGHKGDNETAENQNIQVGSSKTKPLPTHCGTQAEATKKSTKRDRRPRKGRYLQYGKGYYEKRKEKNPNFLRDQYQKRKDYFKRAYQKKKQKIEGLKKALNTLQEEVSLQDSTVNTSRNASATDTAEIEVFHKPGPQGAASQGKVANSTEESEEVREGEMEAEQEDGKARQQGQEAER